MKARKIKQTGKEKSFLRKADKVGGEEKKKILKAVRRTNQHVKGEKRWNCRISFDRENNSSKRRRRMFAGYQLSMVNIFWKKGRSGGLRGREECLPAEQ